MRQVSYTRRTHKFAGIYAVSRSTSYRHSPREDRHVKVKVKKDRGGYLRQPAGGGRIAEMKLPSGEGARPRLRAHKPGSWASHPRRWGGAWRRPLPRTEHGD